MDKTIEREIRIKQQAKETEFSHIHIEIRPDDFVLKVLGKRALVVPRQKGLFAILGEYIKEVRARNWKKGEN